MVTEKPWLQHYEAHVPPQIEYPLTVLPEILTQMAGKYPDRAAIMFKGHVISLRELEALVDRMTAGLQKLGVQQGDRVAVQLPNCPQFVIAYYAILRAGGIVVPCNPLYQAHEMTHQLNNSGSKIIITLSSMYPVIKRIRGNTGLEQVIVAEIKTYFPPLIRLIFSLLLEKKKGHRVPYRGDTNTLAFTDVLNSAQAAPQMVKIEPDDTAVLMYTGGTTGVSKGAELSHHNILVNAYQCKAWLGSEEAIESTLTQVPLFHCYGMTTCMNFGILNANTMIMTPDPRDLKDVIQTIHKFRPTLYPGVPAMYNAINNYGDLQKYDLKSIKVCISGAAGLPVDVQERFHALTGANLAEGYGLSEASPVTHANPVFGENRIGTIGLPWPDTEAMIVDVEEGTRVLGVGDTGELCVRGPQVMKGYWNMPDETANSLRYHGAGDHWLHTGDIATLDADGYFRIVDRKKDMILGAGGYNIYPREIEDALYAHPKVLEAAAIGVPVEGKGERIKVFIVLKPGETATEKEFITFCQENLAAYKIPKFVEFREVLPKTTVGKILRRELVQQEMEKLSLSGREHVVL
jgi:long-chain acyl-CoA synthetase